MHTDDIAKIEVTSSVSLLQLNFSGLVRGLQPKIKAMINDNKLGDVYFISTGYIHDMRDRAFEFSEWRKDPVLYQHPIYGGQHNIDLLRWLAGEVEEVRTIATHKGFKDYPTDDTFIMQMKLANGGVGDVITSYAPIVPREFHLLSIYGTKGTLHDENVFIDRKPFTKQIVLNDSEYKGVPQFRKQISTFVDCVINNDNKGLVTAQDGAKTVSVIEACLKSLKTNEPVLVEKV